MSVVGGCCGTTPGPPRGGRRRRAATWPRPARSRSWEPGCASIYSHVPYDQTPSFLVVGERTNANGSKRFREAMLADDWDTCVAMARDQVKEGAHVLDVCVDYTGEDGVADMARGRRPLRHPGHAAAHARLDRAGRDRDRPAAASPASPSSTRSTSRTATPPAPGSTASCPWPGSTAPPSSAPASTPRARPAPPSGSCGRPGPSTTSPSTATGWSPTDLLFDPLVLPLSTGMEESRRDGIETIEGIRRIKAALPGVPHHPRAVERVASASTRPPATSSTRCSCTSASRPASTPPSSTRPGSCRSTRSTRGPSRSAST